MPVAVVAAALRSPRAPQSRPPKIVLVDRHSLSAAAVSTLLSSPPVSAEVHVMTRLADLQWLPDPNIDLVICDLRSEPMTGVELVRALKRKGYAIPVILLGDAVDKLLMLEALQVGAAGLFETNTPVELFESGVMAVLQGYRAIGPSLLDFSLTAALASLRGGHRRDQPS
jgi:DNA-binding NarL/FixJ family response regulator